MWLILTNVSQTEHDEENQKAAIEAAIMAAEEAENPENVAR